MQHAAPEIVLASGSAYRRQLFERLVLPFSCTAPDTDESRFPNELPAQLATRLATAKALAVAARYPHCLVIGSDQVAARGNEVLGKPGTAANARAQLAASSGRQIVFYTACCVHFRCAQYQYRDVTRVNFRELSPACIDTYIKREMPYDCAGSFKAESLGIVLFESIESTDPTALVGLPLIWLSGTLHRLGVPLP